MNFFDQAALRLKQSLQVEQDKEVATLLAMSARAWAGRKKNDSFPEVELRALAQRRPDLGIDVEYVLTGGRLSDHERQAIERARQITQTWPGIDDADRERLHQLNNDAAYQTALQDALRAAAIEPLSDDERELLEMFRAAPLAAKVNAIKALQGNARKGGMSQTQQTFNAPVSGRVAGRDYLEHDPPTKRGAKKR